MIRVADIFENEFDRKSIIAGLIRTAMILVSVLLLVAGSILFFFSLRIIGNILIIIGVAIIGYSVYQSYTDKSAIKWVNIAAKVLMIVIYLMLLYSLNFGA